MVCDLVPRKFSFWGFKIGILGPALGAPLEGRWLEKGASSPPRPPSRWSCGEPGGGGLE